MACWSCILYPKWKIRWYPPGQLQGVDRQNGRKYKKIYHLCKSLHTPYLKMKDTAFSDITMNGTQFVNTIGMYIFNHWHQYNRADIHSTPDDKFLALVREHFDKFNMLSQAKVLCHVFSLWGMALDKDKMKKVTDDKCLQAMTILFTEGLCAITSISPLLPVR